MLPTIASAEVFLSSKQIVGKVLDTKYPLSDYYIVYPSGDWIVMKLSSRNIARNKYSGADGNTRTAEHNKKVGLVDS